MNMNLIIRIEMLFIHVQNINIQYKE